MTIRTSPSRLQTYHGTTSKGRFVPDDPVNFRTAFFPHEGKRVQVTVGREKKKRSSQQNKYLWGCVYKLISDCIGEPAETVHELMKYKFHYKIVEANGKELRVSRSTPKLGTMEFIDYYKQIQQWASEFLNLYIPDPNEAPLEIYE